MLPFSCKARYFCPSCHQKRVLSYGEWVEESVLAPVAHRQYVFTVPKLLRPIFSRRRALLGRLCMIGKDMLVEAYRAAAPEGVAGLILCVQTFGDLVNFNPHIHVLAADGVFLQSGAFAPLPAVPVKLLVGGLRTRVLDLLEREGEVSGKLRSAMMAWRHSGFSVHNAVRVGAKDAEGRKVLARYMLRAPFYLEKMHYDERRGTVIYRSHMHKGLKRDFQVMPGVEWLELLCRHIPDRFEHLVRYAGWYSNRSRARRRQQSEQLPDADPRDEELACAHARSSWARLAGQAGARKPLFLPRPHSPRSAEVR